MANSTDIWSTRKALRQVIAQARTNAGTVVDNLMCDQQFTGLDAAAHGARRVQKTSKILFAFHVIGHSDSQLSCHAYMNGCKLGASVIVVVNDGNCEQEKAVSILYERSS